MNAMPLEDISSLFPVPPDEVPSLGYAVALLSYLNDRTNQLEEAQRRGFFELKRRLIGLSSRFGRMTAHGLHTFDYLCLPCGGQGRAENGGPLCTNCGGLGHVQMRLMRCRLTLGGVNYWFGTPLSDVNFHLSGTLLPPMFEPTQKVSQAFGSPDEPKQLLEELEAKIDVLTEREDEFVRRLVKAGGAYPPVVRPEEAQLGPDEPEDPWPEVEQLSPKERTPEALAERIRELRSPLTARRVKAYNGLRTVSDAALKAAWLLARPADCPAGWYRDCLETVDIDLASVPHGLRRAFVTVVSPGYEDQLRMMEDTLRRRGACPDVPLVVFAVNESYEALKAQEGLVLVRCRALGRCSPMLKGAIYSAGNILGAEAIVSLEADMLVAGSLLPLWGIIERSRPTDIFGCAAQYRVGSKETIAPLMKWLSTINNSHFALDESDQVAGFGAGDLPFSFNGGLIAGKRSAFVALEREFHRLNPRLVAWIEGGNYAVSNDEIAMNICAARACVPRQLAGVWNAQIFGSPIRKWVDFQGGRYEWGGAQARILHFISDTGKRLMADSYDRVIEMPGQVRVPKLIHHIWLGEKPLPKRYERFIESWKQKHPEWQHKLWRDADAAALTMRCRAAFDSAQNLGWRSDILRYEVLYAFGGVYADTDIECLKNIDPLVAHGDFLLGMNHLDDATWEQNIENAFIASAPYHPFLRHVLDGINAKFEAKKTDPEKYHWWDGLIYTGPRHVTECIRTYRADSENKSRDIVLLPSRFIYPTGWQGAHVFFANPDAFPDAYMLHYWDGTWVEDETIDQSHKPGLKILHRDLGKAAPYFDKKTQR